jgi:hypothetical protein
MSRIVTPEGMIPQGDGAPRPPTLQERVNEALEHWQFKRKDQAFATALNCILYLSSGLAGMAKLTQALEEKDKAREGQLEELRSRLAALEARP